MLLLQIICITFTNHLCYFYFLFDVLVTNAYILYKHYTTNSEYRTIKDFRIKLANLIGDYWSCFLFSPSSLITTFPSEVNLT